MSAARFASDVELPPGVVSVRIDPLTGKRASANEPVGMFEYFMTPYVPTIAN